MELRQLRYFLAVADELHFTRAAERLGVAQPPLSQQIQGLERELGALLFERTKRRVKLTAAGHAFRALAIETLEKASQAAIAAQNAHRGEDGVLRVGFAGSISYTKLPSAIRSFRMAFPRVSVVLKELRTPEQVNELHAGRLDIGIVRAEDVRSTWLTTRVLLRERFYLAVASGDPLAKQSSVPLASLHRREFVMYPRDNGPGLYQQVRVACQAAGFDMVVSQYASQIPTILSFVAAGIGVAIIPQSVASVRWNGVRFRPLESGKLESVVGLTYSQKDLVPLWQSFVKHLVEFKM